jgi:ribosomal protein S20
MPVTKTAKRALRGSKRKADVNKSINTRLEMAMRMAKRDKTKKAITEAISLADKAAKKHFIHKNKAAHIKSSLDLLTKTKTSKSK